VPRTGTRFRLGDRVVVEATDVSLARRQVTFALVERLTADVAPSRKVRSVRANDGKDGKRGERGKPEASGKRGKKATTGKRGKAKPGRARRGKRS
jgi:hypothetical protein